MNKTEVKEVPAQVESTAPKQYEVGYGKPPKSTQFKPGQRVTPRGAARAAKTVSIPVSSGN